MNWLNALIFSRSNDLTTYFLPTAYFFKRTLLAMHQLPFWNPLQLGGYPYLADPQNFIFYLPNYLILLLPPKPAFLLLLAGHLLWAGLGTWWLGRRVFRLSSWVALLSALLFVFTPKLMAHLEAGHYTMIVAFSWLPWFIFVLLRFLRHPTLTKTFYLAVISWVIYINYINIAVFVWLFAAAFTSFILWRSQPRRFWQIICLGFVCITLFLGLIAPNLLPQLEMSRLSTRQLLTFSDVAQPVWSFRLFALNLFFPFFLDSSQLATERVLFPGLLVWLLAAVGLTADRRHRAFFLAWIIFSALFSLGARVPVFGLFYRFLPLFRWLRVPSRIWIISNLLLAVYAGIGLARLKKRLLVLGLMPLIFIDLLLVNQRIFSRVSLRRDLPPRFYRFLAEDKQKPFRVYCPVGCFSLEKLGLLGLDSLAGNNPLQLKIFPRVLQDAAGYHYSGYTPILPPYQVFSRFPQPDSIKMGRLNVKYLVSPYPLTDPLFKLIARQSGYSLYANPAAQALRLTGQGRVRLLQYSPNTIVVEVNSASRSVLTLSQFNYPGWQVKDQHGNVYPLSPRGIWPQVSLSPGVYRLTFSYFPLSLKIGLALFSLTWAIIIYASCRRKFVFPLHRARRRSLR